MKKYVYLILCSVLTGCTHESPSFPLDVGERPESITKGFDGKFFVTVMNGRESGDAVVKVIDGTSVVDFTTGLDEPKGICFVGDFLVLTDLTTVWKIDSKGKKTVLAGKDDFPVEVRYLNDIVVAPEGDAVYVTDMGDRSKMLVDGKLNNPDTQVEPYGRVFKIMLDGTVSIEIDTSDKMPNPNGVGIANDGSILVGAFLRGNVLQRQADGSLKALTSGVQGADAVEQGDDGYFYTSSWSQGKVWRIDGETGEKTVLIDGLQSAADFYLDEPGKRILVPDMFGGKIYEVKL